MNLLLALLLLKAAYAETPENRAYQIAARQARLQKISKELGQEAEKLSDPKLRKDALALLETPRFEVFEARKAKEAELVQQLKKENLYSSNLPLFPNRPASHFLSAPGSTWNGHHSYPGGLTYHTYFNLVAGLGFVDSYKKVYGIELNKDWVRLAAIWHDAAKTFTLEWKENGSCTEAENMIAGTAAHHIWAITEVLYRKYPSHFAVILASAHSPPFAGGGLQEMIGYLRAASILAGVSFQSAGLTSDGKSLAHAPPLEAFVNHMDDHDYVLSSTTMNKMATISSQTLDEQDFWKRNELFSKDSDISLYFQLLKGLEK